LFVSLPGCPPGFTEYALISGESPVPSSGFALIGRKAVRVFNPQVAISGCREGARARGAGKGAGP